MLSCRVLEESLQRSRRKGRKKYARFNECSSLCRRMSCLVSVSVVDDKGLMMRKSVVDVRMTQKSLCADVDTRKEERASISEKKRRKGEVPDWVNRSVELSFGVKSAILLMSESRKSEFDVVSCR